MLATAKRISLLDKANAIAVDIDWPLVCVEELIILCALHIDLALLRLRYDSLLYGDQCATLTIRPRRHVLIDSLAIGLPAWHNLTLRDGHHNLLSGRILGLRELVNIGNYYLAIAKLLSRHLGLNWDLRLGKEASRYLSLAKDRSLKRSLKDYTYRWLSLRLNKPVRGLKHVDDLLLLLV